ncbi:MAG: hypothetical protein DWQ42_18820 [Planctomycetota bacterium]|nr:MAG: hypothetical protein DWQ42_18820 [Planctomycetota bacterium]REK43139.1 MAG: hypothetical protein DWQ46_12265 [Planctomycetota bacterium]
MANRTRWALALSTLVAIAGGCNQDTGRNPTSQADRSRPSNVAATGTPQKPATAVDSATGPVTSPIAPEVAAAIPTIQSSPPVSPASQSSTGKQQKFDKVSELPEVLLSEQHEAACRVKVGDVMPDLSLTDTSGNAKSLAELFGSKVTVVCFWDADNPLSNWQLADLEPEVAQKFGEHGVRVVAINRGQSADVAQSEADKAGASFPVLVDEDGQAYDQVATAYLPRTYVLDAAGKILWLDLEYSSATRRHLQQAILFALTN